MPQFDKITFFTQIFWLTIIFFSFYFFTLKVFLPKIATVLKTRKKKILIGSSGLLNLNKEQVSVESSRNNLLQEFSENNKNKISALVADHLDSFRNPWDFNKSWWNSNNAGWVKSHESSTKSYYSMQVNYLKAMGNIMIKNKM